VSKHVYVENVDLTTSFEKVAYFARRPARLADMQKTERDAASEKERTDVQM